MNFRYILLEPLTFLHFRYARILIMNCQSFILTIFYCIQRMIVKGIWKGELKETENKVSCSSGTKSEILLFFKKNITISNVSGILSEMTTSIALHNLLMKTSMFGKSRPLIGPLSCDVTCDATWLRHSGPPTLPQIMFSLDSGVVPINFGQAHVKCLQLLAQHVQEFLKVCYFD